MTWRSGIRQVCCCSYLNETRRIARTFLDRGLGTIVFANSRLATEVLATYLKEDFARAPLGADVIRGYRGDYLSLERREIERGLREGRLLGVVATNALELGIGAARSDRRPRQAELHLSTQYGGGGVGERLRDVSPGLPLDTTREFGRGVFRI